jgi:hypothetical protein
MCSVWLSEVQEFFQIYVTRVHGMAKWLTNVTYIKIFRKEGNMHCNLGEKRDIFNFKSLIFWRNKDKSFKALFF